MRLRSHRARQRAVPPRPRRLTPAGCKHRNLCRRGRLVADCEGALYWPEERALIVADLHLEKGSSYAARGVLLPPYDTAATLARLGASSSPAMRRAP